MLKGQTIPNSFSFQGPVKAALAVAAVGAGVTLAAFGGRQAAGWVCGVSWNFLNILLLKKLADLLGRGTAGRGRQLAFWLAAKFGLLYPAGIGLLWFGVVPVAGFALGFTSVLAAMAAAVGLQASTLRGSHVG